MRRQLGTSRYKVVGDKAQAILGALSVLVGQRLIGARVFAEGTWHFYFGRRAPLADIENGDGTTYLGVECSWRVHNGDTIIIGAEDYDVLGKSADRQLRIILQLIKEAPLLVDSVDGDEVGGLKIRLTGGYSLDVFPASDTEMEWIFRSLNSDSLILMDGALHRADASQEEIGGKPGTGETVPGPNPPDRGA